MAKIFYNLYDIPNAGHCGIETTIQKTLQQYYWSIMYKDIQEYVKSCDIYQWQEKPKKTEKL